MRIWDIHPGYLNRQSLLGEHRELHGLLSILTNGKKGYSRHPETLRWVGRERALARRHILLAREMELRGFTDRTPVELCGGEDRWPETYVDSPDRQFALLADKYAGREQGRIPLPRSVQQLWSHHKYSVLARNPEMYRTIGRQAASGEASFSDLSALLVETLRAQPSPGGIRNAAQHMWGHVSGVREYASDMPPVPCEESKIQQVFYNLLRNGAQAMAAANTASPRFVLRVALQGNMACIEIEDNGPGMPEGRRKRIFEPFFTTKNVGEGTGLGLSVSYFIVVENHGGTLEVDSAPGQGALFIIRLPVENAAENRKEVTA